MAQNRDELAGVLAHESGHMVLHHVAHMMAKADTANLLGGLGSILGQILLGPIVSYGTDMALQTGGTAVMNNLSRHIEAQADEEGAHIVAATNVFNPYGMIWFFEKLHSQFGDKGAFWERNHPFDEARIADLKRLFAAEPQTFGKFRDTEALDVAYW
jgi:predicted Zn-dependent protease